MFLWTEPAKPARGPKPALTLDKIADAAIAVADADGLAAVSMQRVAAELGFTKMSLYRYLPGKAELVAVMLERVIGEAPPLTAAGERDDDPTGAGGWRAGLSEWAGCLLAAYQAHPWAIEATTGARPIGPRELSWLESAIALLPPGLTGAERMDAVAVLAGHVRALAAQADESQLSAAMGVVLRDHAARFPAITSALSDISNNGGRDQAFRFGLERILDGLQVLISAR